MSTWDATWTWLTTAEHWTGSAGVGARTLEHLELAGLSVLLAGVIALPIGIMLGHYGRGGALAINIANAGRAVPTLAADYEPATSRLTQRKSSPSRVCQFVMINLCNRWILN
jgi:hypothetical protein